MSNPSATPSTPAATAVTTVTDEPGFFKQYQLVSQDARALREQRDRVSTMFLSVITLILGAQGYLLVSNKDGDPRSMVLIWVIALFGGWLCLIWRRAIRSFKELLNFRYYALKRWESDAFAQELSYFVAEEVLYHAHDANAVSAIPLGADYVAMRDRDRDRIPFFSDTYSLLPRAAIVALWGIALIRTGFFVLALLAVQIPIHLG